MPAEEPEESPAEEPDIPADEPDESPAELPDESPADDPGVLDSGGAVGAGKLAGALPAAPGAGVGVACATVVSPDPHPVITANPKPAESTHPKAKNFRDMDESR